MPYVIRVSAFFFFRVFCVLSAPVGRSGTYPSQAQGPPFARPGDPSPLKYPRLAHRLLSYLQGQKRYMLSLPSTGQRSCPAGQTYPLCRTPYVLPCGTFQVFTRTRLSPPVGHPARAPPSHLTGHPLCTTIRDNYLMALVLLDGTGTRAVPFRLTGRPLLPPYGYSYRGSALSWRILAHTFVPWGERRVPPCGTAGGWRMSRRCPGGWNTFPKRALNVSRPIGHHSPPL